MPPVTTATRPSRSNSGSLIGQPWLHYERGGAWGTGRFPTSLREKGHAGETGFPPRPRAAGEWWSRGLLPRQPDGVAELADAAVPARAREHEPRERHDLGPRVRRDDRQPDRAQQSASFTSLPRYAVSSRATPRRSASSRRTGSLSSTPWTQVAPILRARAPTAAFTSVDRIRCSTPTAASRRSPSASPRQQATLSSPRSFVHTRLSVNTPSKSKTAKRTA